MRTPVSPSERTAEAWPFEGFTGNSPWDLFSRDARRRTYALRDLAQGEALQLAGLGLWQLRDIFDRARIFIRCNRLLDVFLQLGGQRFARRDAGGRHHIRLDDHAGRLVRRADHAALTTV